MSEPLSSLLRPKSIEDCIGQKHLIGKNGPLRAFLEHGDIPSMIFWGPPGTGKTTVAYIISLTIEADFYRLSGVVSKKEDVMKIIEKAKINLENKKTTIVFLDEIHRWNKAQQDTLLPFVEKGLVILIGATTENPSFTINNALLSRTRVFLFESLKQEDIIEFFKSNLEKIYLSYPSITIHLETLEYIAKLANGDLRNAINILETIIFIKKKGEIVPGDIPQVFKKQIYYDKDADEHFTLISAVHKSLRDSDGDAACYWIGRMIYAGEDPLYVVRRLIRFASEDIGLATPTALILANTTYEIVQKLGMPECDTAIFELALYLAKAQKNNNCYLIANEIKEDIEKYGNLPVPLHLRNADTQFLKTLKYGEGYKYAHDFPDAKVEQEHFPEELKGRKYGKEK